MCIIDGFRKGLALDWMGSEPIFNYDYDELKKPARLLTSHLR